MPSILSRLIRGALLAIACAAPLNLWIFSGPASAAAPQSVPCAPSAIRESINKQALVIANESYGSLADLPTARINAEVALSSLCRSGFRVQVLQNASGPELFSALASFKTQSSDADVSLVYYTGHGLVVGGQDHALGADFVIGQAPLNGPAGGQVSISSIKAAVSGAKGVGIVVFDACRNQSAVPLSVGVVASDPPNILVLYSTTFGLSTYSDGQAPTRFTASFFRNLLNDGWRLQKIVEQTNVELAVPPPPGDPAPAMFTGIITYQFVMRPQRSERISFVQSQPAPQQPIQQASLSAFAELATDYRYHLVYWRVTPGAPRPADPSQALFYDGLDLQARGGTDNFIAARQKYRDAARSSDPILRGEALSNLAFLVATGRGGQPDGGGAVEIWKQAMADGSVAAADSLGVVYRADPGSTWGVPQDYSAAVKLFQLASNGLPAAKTDLAYMYLFGLGVPRDPAKARALFDEAAALQEPNALLYLSDLEWSSNRPLAEALLRKGAFEAREPGAIVQYARRYLALSVTDSRDRVRDALMRSAATGDPASQFWFGYVLECDFRRTPTPELLSKILAQYEAAAAGGYDADAVGGRSFPNAFTELARVRAGIRDGNFVAKAFCPA